MELRRNLVAEHTPLGLEVEKRVASVANENYPNNEHAVIKYMPLKFLLRERETKS